MSTVSDAARRAAEAARRAAEEAKRKAAEEARRQAAAAAAAKLKAAAAQSKPKPDAAAVKKAAANLSQRAGDKPMASAVRQVFGRDEVSNGLGRALRDRAGATLGGPSTSQQALSDKPSFKLSDLMRGGAPTTAATSLRTEVLGDGKANCLERAVKLAKPGDSVVLLTDKQDPVGHAVVRRADGSVVDPNRPEQPYKDLKTFQQQNPRYQNPASISDVTAEKLLRTPPGPQRDKLIADAGLTGLASRSVADPPQVVADYQARATQDAATIQSTYDNALRSGKSEAEAANAAAKKLDELSRASTDPEYVRRLTEAAAPTIERIANTAGQAARDDLDRDKDLMKETIGLLAGVADRGGSDVIASKLAKALPDDTELEEIDDALFEHMEGGGESTLARDLHDALRTEGKTEAALGLADNEHGDDLELLVIREAQAQLDGGASAQSVMDQYGDYLTTHVAETVARTESEDSEPAMQLLASLAEKGGEDVTNAIAQQLASKVPDQSNLQKLDDVLSDLAHDGKALNLSSALVEELSRLGKTKAVEELSDVLLTGLDGVRGDYESARSKREEADQTMQAMLSQFDGLLTPEQQSQFIANYRTEHADIYAAEVQAAEKLDDFLKTNGPALDALVAADPGRADDVMKGYEQLALSPLPARAVEWASRTMQAGSPTAAAYADLAEDLQKKVIEPGLAGTLTQYQAEEGGDQTKALERFEALFEDFKTAKGLLEAPGDFASSLDDASEYIDAMKKSAAGDSAALEALLKDKNKLQGLSGFNSSIAAVSLAFAVSNLPGQRGFDLVQSVAGIGEQGLGLAAKVIGSLESSGRLAATGRLAQSAAFLQSKVLPGLGVAISALSTIDSVGDFLREGGGENAARAISSALTLVGGVMTLFPATAPVGIALTIAATVGGAIADAIFGADDRRKFNEEQQRLLEPILTDAFGDTPEVREAVRQIAFGDPNMNELLEKSGMSVQQFVQLMGEVPFANDRNFPQLVDALVDRGITGEKLLETVKTLDENDELEAVVYDLIMRQGYNPGLTEEQLAEQAQFVLDNYL
jgi:hypothetical protein